MIASASVVECANSHNHINHKSDSSISHVKNKGRFFINGPQTISNYKLVTKGNEGQLLFYNAAPSGYVNFTDSQTQTVAALGNAALFLGSLFLLGSLPARVLGIGSRSDYDDYDGGELGHRQGLAAGPPSKSLFKLPKLKLPQIPKPQLPKLPKLQLPSLKLPSLKAPRIPSYKLPKLPKLQLPKLPKLSLPKLPKLSLPSLPKPQLPDIGGLVENKIRLKQNLLNAKLNLAKGVVDTKAGLVTGVVGAKAAALSSLLGAFSKDQSPVKPSYGAPVSYNPPKPSYGPPKPSYGAPSYYH